MKKLTLIVTILIFVYGNLFGQTFTRITTGAIVNDGGQSYGAAWGDYNNDDLLDLFVSNCCDEANFLYLNDGSSTFTKITADDIVVEASGTGGSSWGDYDNDGDLDLVVGGDPNLLYQNNGDGTFTKITAGDIANNPGGSPSWGDYDNDGDLDLLGGGGGYNSLYQNNGDGTFTKITTGDIVWDEGNSPSWGDYDNDGDLDLFVANYGYSNCLYQNNGDGTFTKITTGEIVNDGGASSTGGSWGDYDSDGDLDLYVTNGGFHAVEDNFLYTNNGDGTFTKITEGDIVNNGGQSNGSSWVDYDNDGDLDLFVTNGGLVLNNHENFLYNNNGDETFTKNTDEAIVIPVQVWYWSVGSSWGDYDNDGDIDLFVSNDNGRDNYLYANNGNDNNWINVKAVGVLSNISAIGTKVRIKATINGNPVWQLREISGQTGGSSQNSLNAEFGLGDATIIDSIRVEWPSCIVQILTSVAVNQFLTIEEEIEPEISVIPPDTLDFGIVYIGYPDTLQVEVKNIGFDTLNVSDVSVTGDGFSADTDPFILDVDESDSINVVFETTSEQAYTGTLTISSNDPNNPTVTLDLIGEGLLPSDISVSPDSLSDSLLTGASSIQYLTIDNTNGNGDLIWEIDFGGIGLGTVTFTKEDYADWTLLENQDRITDSVWITRANTEGIFNIATESDYNWNSPNDTEWSYGFTADLEPSDYTYWVDAVDESPPDMVGQPMSVHLISDDLYLDILFHSWTSGGNGGGFSYTRTDVRPIWLSVNPDSGVVSAGANQVVAVNFNATGLAGGDYEASIVINSNDPDEPEIVVSVYLNVAGASDIYVEMDTLDFGNIFINYSDTLSLLVKNLGTEDLLISSAIVSPDEYAVSPSFAGIDPGDVEEFLVNFSPTAVGTYPGTLTFTTTDPDEGTYVVLLEGAGIEPPIVGVFPDSLSTNLFTNDSTQQHFTIYNTGNSDLFYEIFTVSVNPEKDMSKNMSRPPRRNGSETNSSLRLTSLKDLLHIDSKDFKNRKYSDVNWETTTKSSQTLQTEPAWRLLYTDPDEPEVDFDVQHVFGGITQDEILFKLENYNPIINDEFGVIIVIDADQDTSTGLNIDEYYWLLGIDYIIECEEDYGALMQCVSYGDEWDFIWIDDLSTYTFEIGSPDLIFGINRTHFEEFSAINIAILVFADEVDQIPDQGNGHITFPLSPLWLSLSPEDGVIPPGGNEDITVTFDATRLFGGDYYAAIQVLSNDPVNPEVIIPAHLSVTGRPIYSGPDTLDLGTTFIGYPDSIFLIIDNVGTEVLEISDITTNNGHLSAVPTSLSIPPMSSDTVTLILLVETVGTFTANVSFSTNDSNEPSVAIPVISEVLIAPVITVEPQAFELTLSSDSTATKVFYISNSSGSDLIWEISLNNADFSTVTFTKSDYANWILPENQDRITDNVWITRANTQGIFNIAAESSYNYNSPYDTEWAFGYTEDSAPEDYQNWRNAVNYNPPGMVGQPLSLHLISDDIYFDIMFHSWTSGGNGGGFSYTRTPAAPGWFTISQESGVTPVDSTDEVIVNFDVHNLESGEYNANIIIASNDPEDPTTVVTVACIVFLGSEPLLSLTHTPGDLNMGIFNNGVIGRVYVSETGPGVTWKGENGLFTGGVIFGTSTVANCNGFPYFVNYDLLNVASDFASGFISDDNFDQITQVALNDNGAPTPYEVEILQFSYTNTGDELGIVRYGFINTTDSTLNDFYAGLFMDWDIGDYDQNTGGYDLDRDLVYNFSFSGSPYYYGFAALDGLSGARTTTGNPSEGRHAAFMYITTFDLNIDTPGDFIRSMGGTGPYDIASGDTAWATFAIVAGDNLAGIAVNANDARAKAFNLGWIDIPPLGIEDSVADGLPMKFNLNQNYPNPFNPITTIEYAIPKKSDVTITVYNIIGQVVDVLVDQTMEPGYYSVQWDARRVGSGVYFYRIMAGDPSSGSGHGFTDVKKCVILK